VKKQITAPLNLMMRKEKKWKKTITIEDLDQVVEGLKTNKAPGTSGFTNEFYI
jgi:hypothetical protein